MRRILLSAAVGLLIGTIAGLTVGWLILPRQASNSPLSDLSARYKDDYAVMVAAGFQIDGDLNAAIERLALLGVSNTFTYVRDVTERFISQAGSGRESDIRMLVELSCALGYCTPPMEVFRLPTPVATPG